MEDGMLLGGHVATLKQGICHPIKKVEGRLGSTLVLDHLDARCTHNTASASRLYRSELLPSKATDVPLFPLGKKIRCPNSRGPLSASTF